MILAKEKDENMNFWITPADVKMAKVELGRHHFNKITKEEFNEMRRAGFSIVQSKLGALQMAVEQANAILEAD